MRVNGIDIRKYDAKQLTVELSPPSFTLNTEWVEGAATPLEFETEVQYGDLKLTILFQGKDRNDVNRKISEFLALFTSRCRLQLDRYKGTYIGDIQKNQVTKTQSRKHYILTLELKGYMTDAEVSNVYRYVYGAKFVTLGTRDAPCVIEVLPTVDLTEYTITGFGDDPIVLSNLKQNKTVVIDGTTGKVTQEGMNKFGDCDMWAFPVLRKGKEYNITFSSNRCAVTIHYSPMWL